MAGRRMKTVHRKREGEGGGWQKDMAGRRMKTVHRKREGEGAAERMTDRGQLDLLKKGQL